MKKIVAFGSVMAIALALTGCKSDLDKYADELCDCKDKACAEEVGKRWSEKMKGKEKDNKKLEEMSEAEAKAFAKILECSMKLK